MDVEQLSHLIRRRRTIKPLTKAGQRNYQDREIERSILQAILENANWAPTHGLTEPWRFAVFLGAAREQLAARLSEVYRQHTPPEKYRAAKHEKMSANVLAAPCTIALGMARHPGKIPAEEEVMAVTCAVQNMHLTATAFGLGAFWSSSPAYDHPDTKSFLGWHGDEDRCLGMFFLGYPLADWPERPQGKPGSVEEKTSWRLVD